MSTKQVTRTTTQVTRENNKKKIKAVYGSRVWNCNPNYRLDFSFILNANQDMNDPIEHLSDCLGGRVADRLTTGSGTCLMTGDRDFSFEGTKEEMSKVLKIFEVSEFRIRRMTVSVCEVDPKGF